MTYNKLDNLLFFVLGFILGGFFLIIVLGIFQSRRISQYEQIIDRLQSRNRWLTDEVSKKSDLHSTETENCIFCGKEIPKGEIICSSCIKDNL